MSDTPEPMTPTDPERHGDAEPDTDDLEVPVDPADPLKRDGEEDMPSLDPTPPPIAPD